MSTRQYCARCLTTFVEDASHCPNLACGARKPPTGWPSVLGPGDLIDRHYRVERTLAVGGAGICYLAREVGGDDAPTGPELAVKVLFDQRDSGPFLRRLANEAQILQELAHEHIVECRGFVQRTGHPPYLVTLFEHGGSLYDHIKDNGPQPPRIAAGTLRQILLALDVAHQRGVVHRDLKPQNVLLRQPVAQHELPHTRVADFGIAKLQGQFGEGLTRVGGFVGTPEYAAPEQFLGETPTAATDLWAAGVVLWFLLVGESPFRFTHRHDIAASLDEVLRQLPLALALPGADPAEVAPLQDVLDGLLRERPDERWTAWQVLHHLRPMIGASDIPERVAGPTRASAPRPTEGADATFVDGGFGADPGEPAPRPTSTLGQGTLAPTISTPAPTARRAPVPAPRKAPSAYTAPSAPAAPQSTPRPTGVPRPAPPPAAPSTPQRSVIPLPEIPTRPSPQAPPPPPRAPKPVVAETPISAPPRDAAPYNPNELSLDDLFAPAKKLEVEAPVMGELAFEPEPQPPARHGTPEPRPEAPREAGRMSVRAPPPSRPAPPPEPAKPRLPEKIDPATVFFPWCPDEPQALPDPLPQDAGRLLEVIGTAHPDDRPHAIATLGAMPPTALANVARTLRLGSPAALSRGVALAIAALARADLAPTTRTLLTDPDPSVRICAADAVAAIGRGAMLPPLQKLLSDPAPTVRIAAAAAVVRACRANERPDMARKWLEALATDPNEDVRRAGKAALVLLDG